jgi:hypothetical protein
MTLTAASRLLLIALCAAGCSQQSRSPVAPEPASANVPSTIRVTGHVLDGESRPVAGARLITDGGPAGVLEGLSDAEGRYQFTVHASVVPYAVMVTKDGFEQSWSPLNTAHWGSGEVRTDVRLYAIQRMAAGQSVDILVRQDDPRCVFDFIDNYRCRQVRVVSHSRGRLSLKAVVTQDDAVDGQSVVLTLALPAAGGPANTEIVVPVEAGTEVAVQLSVHGDASPQRVTLQTAFSK